MLYISNRTKMKVIQCKNKKLPNNVLYCLEDIPELPEKLDATIYGNYYLIGRNAVSEYYELDQYTEALVNHIDAKIEKLQNEKIKTIRARQKFFIYHN